MCRTANGETVIEWEDFGDYPAAIRGRCTNCWGQLIGGGGAQAAGAKRWTSIECRLCGKSVEGEKARSEMVRMRHEADGNRRRVSQGLPAKYCDDAMFVLKVLPDMDRDKAHIDNRIAANIKAGGRSGWLSRLDFPEGTAGDLYLQASLVVAGIDSLPGEMSVVRVSDFDLEKPWITGVDVEHDGSARVSAKATGRFRPPPPHVLLERMGSVMMWGLNSAFACELALKVILITRRDEAKKTHDLLRLYKDLPEDSRTRMEADFAEIEDVLDKGRHTFGRLRYFQKAVGVEAMLAMVNTEKAFQLAKAARVIIDEGQIAGLTYKVDINAEHMLHMDNGNTSQSATCHLKVTSGEAPIPWDLLLPTGRRERP